MKVIAKLKINKHGNNQTKTWMGVPRHAIRDDSSTKLPRQLVHKHRFFSYVYLIFQLPPNIHNS